MTLDFNAIIPAVITGLIASVFAPWMNWHLEKVRLLHQSRKEKIQEWYTRIEAAQSFCDIQCSLLWEELKPYLTEDERREMFTVILVRRDGSNTPSGEELKLSKLLGVVAKIQKEWGLI